MRILYFSRDYTTHDYRFLAQLAAAPHEVWFLQLNAGPRALETRPIPRGIRVARWPNRLVEPAADQDLTQIMPDFKEIVKNIQPDLIHAGPVHSSGFMTALLDFHPFMLMSWASDLLLDAENDPACRWRSEFALSRADRLICDCNTVRTKARNMVAFPDEDIVQFPWGVDLTHFSPQGGRYDYRFRSGWQDCRVILSNRSWESIYGIETLLRAFRIALETKPDLRLVLLGRGSQEAEIRSKINEYGLHDVIWTPGIVTQSQLPEYLRSADLYVSCARCDGSSISLLEAMATGLPVVITDIPGNREWVQHEENGWLAPEGDCHAFAEMIIRAASLEDHERAQIAETNLSIVAERADWQRNFAKLLQAYGEYASN